MFKQNSGTLLVFKSCHLEDNETVYNFHNIDTEVDHTDRSFLLDMQGKCHPWNNHRQKIRRLATANKL